MNAPVQKKPTPVQQKRKPKGVRNAKPKPTPPVKRQLTPELPPVSPDKSDEIENSTPASRRQQYDPSQGSGYSHGMSIST